MNAFILLSLSDAADALKFSDFIPTDYPGGFGLDKTQLLVFLLFFFFLLAVAK